MVAAAAAPTAAAAPDRGKAGNAAVPNSTAKAGLRIGVGADEGGADFSGKFPNGMRDNCAAPPRDDQPEPGVRITKKKKMSCEKANANGKTDSLKEKLR